MREYRLSDKQPEVFYGEIFCLGEFTRSNGSSEYVINMMIYDQLNYLINNILDDTEKFCIKQYYYNNKKQQEIADLKKCDQAYISRKLRSGREKLLGSLLELKDKNKMGRIKDD